MIKSKMHCLNPRFLPAGALQQPWSRTPPASILIRSTTFPTSREVWPQNDLKSSYQHDEEQINSPAANKGYFHVLSGGVKPHMKQEPQTRGILLLTRRRWDREALAASCQTQNKLQQKD